MTHFNSNSRITSSELMMNKFMCLYSCDLSVTHLIECNSIGSMIEIPSLNFCSMNGNFCVFYVLINDGAFFTFICNSNVIKNEKIHYEILKFAAEKNSRNSSLCA